MDAAQTIDDLTDKLDGRDPKSLDAFRLVVHEQSYPTPVHNLMLQFASTYYSVTNPTQKQEGKREKQKLITDPIPGVGEIARFGDQLLGGLFGIGREVISESTGFIANITGLPVGIEFSQGRFYQGGSEMSRDQVVRELRADYTKQLEPLLR